MYQYGIIGYASITPRFMEGISLSENGKVIALTSSRDDLKLNNIQVYQDYSKMLQDLSIDIVYIPTPNYLHYQNAQQAILAKKHVIVEKPFTMDSVSGQRLFSLAKEKGVFIMEAQKIAFLPSTIWLENAFKNNTIGDLKSISLRQSFKEGEKDHWTYDDNKGGGVVYGSANYPLEFMMHLFKTTNLNDFQATRYTNNYRVDEIVDFSFNIDNISVNAYISRKEIFPSQAIFTGSKGQIIIDNFWRAKSLKVIINNVTEIVKFDFKNEFVFEVNHIHDCLNKGLLTSPIMTPDITMATLKYVEEIKTTPGLPVGDYLKNKQ